MVSHHSFESPQQVLVTFAVSLHGNSFSGSFFVLSLLFFRYRCLAFVFLLGFDVLLGDSAISGFFGCFRCFPRFAGARRVFFYFRLQFLDFDHIGATRRRFLFFHLTL